MNTQEITEKIVKMLKMPQVSSSVSFKSNKESTEAMMRWFIKICDKDYYGICTTGSLGCENGWLYDMVWFRNNNPDNPKHLKEIGLVLESEWSKNEGEVRYDFEKLLIAKASIKVMIFQENNNLSHLFSMMKEGIEQFCAAKSGEVYILVGFNNNEHIFEVETITW